MIYYLAVLTCIVRFSVRNVLFTLNRTTHSSKTLLCVVRFNVNKTLQLRGVS